MTPLRTTIVGSGFVARVHAAAVRDLGGTVVAVCSRTRPGAQKLADEVGDMTAYDSLAELLGGEAVDVVHVCIPNALHAEPTLLALEHGAHVVCEKPLATGTKESRRMLAALGDGDRVGAVAYHVRGYPLVEHMRATIAEGEFGGATRRARPLHLRRRAARERGLAATPRELGPHVRDRGSRRALVRSRRARDRFAHLRGARGLSNLRSGPGARGSYVAVGDAAQRDRRRLVRSKSRS